MYAIRSYYGQCRLVENNVIVPCTDERLADPNVQEAPPLYGIFIYDMVDHTQLVITSYSIHYTKLYETG